MQSPSQVPFNGDRSVAEAESRRNVRHPGRGLAEVVRDADPLRQALRVELLDISLSGVSLLTAAALQPDERVRIRLRNVVQRFLKEVRAVVRWTLPAEDGRRQVGLELLQSFTALDMQMLRRAGIGAADGDGRSWV